MKIVDIYFWQKAYNLSPISRISALIDEYIKESAKISPSQESLEKIKIKILDIANKLNTENKSKYLTSSRKNWSNELKSLLKSFDANKIKDKCEEIIKEYYKKSLIQ